MKLDRTLLAIVVPAAVTFGGGLIEMRVAIARLQEQVTSVEQRVERIENRLDTRRLSKIDKETP